jgi:hypothetical protein
MKSKSHSAKTRAQAAKRAALTDDLGTFQYFEVMDRAAMAANNLEQNIGGHPVVARDAQIAKAYQAVSDALGEFYQIAGARFFEIQEAAEI